MGCFSFPVPACHAQGVFDSAVGDAARSRQLGDEFEVFAVVGAILGETVLECRSDARFVVGTAELDDLIEFVVVALYVWVGWHEGDSNYCGSFCFGHPPAFALLRVPFAKRKG